MAVTSKLYKNLPINSYVPTDEFRRMESASMRYEPTPIPNEWYDELEEMEREAAIDSFNAEMDFRTRMYRSSRPQPPSPAEQMLAFFWLLWILVTIATIIS